MSTRTEKIREILREVAAEYILREASPQSLITVTRTSVTEDGKRGTIFISVLPDSAETAALDFTNRHRRDLAHFFKTRVKGVYPPHMEFVIDKGEKMRQRLDELS